MDLKEFYEAVGGDYDEVFSRLQRDALILKFVKRFASDRSYRDLKKAEEEKDIKGAFLAAHTLKGIACTLGIKNLTDAASDLTEQLRSLKDFPDKSLFKAVDIAYEQAVKLISEL